jgi:hypothetical protein
MPDAAAPPMEEHGAAGGPGAVDGHAGHAAPRHLGTAERSGQGQGTGTGSSSSTGGSRDGATGAGHGHHMD